MKPVFKYSLAVLPLLSILSMSPADVHVKFGRSIASEDQKIEVEKEKIEKEKIEFHRPHIARGEIKPDIKIEKSDAQPKEELEIKKEKIEIAQPKVDVSDIKVDLPKIKLENQDKHPKLTELSSRVEKDALKQDPNLDIEKLKAKRDELKVSLLKQKDEFKKGESDKEIVAKQRKEIERLVVELLVVDGGLKDLQDATKVDPTEEEKTKLVISESEDIIEDLISELQKNEELVAKALPKKEEDKPVVIAEKVENKKDDVRKEIVKKDVEKKEEKKDEDCEQDKNLVTSKQLDALVAQQNQIMQAMMNMTQMMMMQSMMIQQQMMMSQMNMNTMGNQVSPYQYANQTTSGNWVYYPQGFQANQQNIFSGPQMGQNGMYPGQMNGYQPQSQSSWGLRPQMSFGEAAPMNGNFGFNMGGANTINPMVQGQPQLQSPVAQPQMQTLPFQLPQQQQVVQPQLLKV